ncbi:ankyrin repeat domain-containing protein [Marinomonas sp. ef1]|uniref:ankyrin repeat domain-containing protein n=1 Tax=Marinomonas sp. ef1 TaxID=2005043 RepID=UPI000C293B04|nr:hypothetical protein [Marinomonas sp. ef1]
MVYRLINSTVMLLFVLLSISGCSMSGLDAQTRQYVALYQLGEPFKDATDAQAVKLINTTSNSEQIILGGIIGLWDQRPALLDAALSKGFQPNQPISNRLFVSYPQNDFTKPSPLFAAYAVMPLPPIGSAIDNRAQLTPAMLVRDMTSFERLMAAGADYNPTTLNIALKVATIYGESPKLAEHLLAMGGNLQADLNADIPPLIISLASQGKPQMMLWLLAQGIDPNSRYSTPTNRRYYDLSGGAPFYSYLLDATPLYFLPTYTPDDSSRKRAIEMAKVLIDAGANVNSTATFSYSIRNDNPITGWTPLHTYHIHLNQTYGNPELVNFLIANGANPQALTSKAQTPLQVTGLMERTQQQIVDLDNQRRRQIEQQNAQAKQQEQNDSGNIFGKVIAITGLTAVGAAASNTGVDSSSVVDIVGGGIADIMTDGRAGGLQQAQQRQQTQANTAAQNNTSTSLKPAANFQTETYRVSCPSGVSNDIPLRYKTQQCRTAMIDFAKAYSCNDYQRFEQVHAACDQACGSVNCLQE